MATVAPGYRRVAGSGSAGWDIVEPRDELSMRAVLGVVLAALFACPGLAHAEQRTDELLRHCEGGADEEGLAKSFYCTGYLGGFMDGLALVDFHGGKLPFCLPKGLHEGDIEIAFSKWVHAHPANLKETARASIVLALRAEYPCE